MSGGGKSVLRGRMGQSVAVKNVDPKQLEKMETELRTMEERVQALRQQQTRLESEVSDLEPELNHAKCNLDKCVRTLEESKKQEPRLLQQIKAQEAKTKKLTTDPAEVRRLETVVEAAKVKYDKAAGAAQKIQVKVDELTAEITEKTGGKMKAIDKVTWWKYLLHIYITY